MPTKTPEEIARELVSPGKGLLAADETVHTLTRRFAERQLVSTPETRRDYRELFFTTPGIADFISGVILQDETIHQKSTTGVPIPELLASHGIIPGIKVDTGAKPLAGSPQELITEGLDGLRPRLEAYRELGARFAKWRAVIVIADGLPTLQCVKANAHALARYASLCQEQQLVPIVEPEVLMEGAHGLDRSEKVTERVQQQVFDALFELKVRLEAMLLKPSMVIAGQRSPKKATVHEVAAATLRTLERHVPPAVPGIVFLSGGQDPVLATRHLNELNQLEGRKPWPLTFSYGRALQDEALAAWGGKPENLSAGQHAFYHRARCVSAAARGKYGSEMEREAAAA